MERGDLIGRSTDEWVGRDANDPVPARVRVRVFDRKRGKCHRCTRKIMAGEEWTCEHVKALINGGENREANLDLTCCNCLPEKNAEDVAEKSKVASIRAKHLGVEKKKYRWWRGRA